MWGGGARRKADIRREMGGGGGNWISKQWEGLAWKTRRSRLAWKTTSPVGSPQISLWPDCFLVWLPKEALYVQIVLLKVGAGQRHGDHLGLLCGPTPDLLNQNGYMNKTSSDASHSLRRTGWKQGLWSWASKSNRPVQIQLYPDPRVRALGQASWNLSFFLCRIRMMIVIFFREPLYKLNEIT